MSQVSLCVALAGTLRRGQVLYSSLSGGVWSWDFGI
jgi:hypothetical protein